jgi:tRNA-specific adenosine deaminase 1
LDTFNALPQKFKPRTLADGRREWSPLAGIVLSRRKCLQYLP